MRIYVAFRTDVDPTEKIANGSMTVLRGIMKGTHDASGAPKKKAGDNRGAEYTVVTYVFKPSLGNVCQAIADITELPADASAEYRINDKNQLREVK